MTRSKKQLLGSVRTKRQRLEKAQREYDDAVVEARDDGAASWRELEAARRGIPVADIPLNGSGTATVRGVYRKTKARAAA